MAACRFNATYIDCSYFHCRLLYRQHTTCTTKKTTSLTTTRTFLFHRCKTCQTSIRQRGRVGGLILFFMLKRTSLLLLFRLHACVWLEVWNPPERWLSVKSCPFPTEHHQGCGNHPLSSICGRAHTHSLRVGLMPKLPIIEETHLVNREKKGVKFD